MKVHINNADLDITSSFFRVTEKVTPSTCQRTQYPMSDRSTLWPKHTFGVYLIRNVENGRVIVGVTGRSFHERWTSHRRDLRAGRHGNCVLQNAYVKTGEASFVFEVLEVMTERSPALSAQREDHWIATLKGRVEEGGYNLRDGEGFAKWSDSARSNQSIAAGKRRGWLYRFKSPTGEIVEPKDFAAFCREHGLGAQPMRWVFQRRLLSYKGYTHPDSDFVPLSQRHYVFVDPRGNEHEATQLKAFAILHGLNRAALASLASGTYKSHHGWTLKSAKRSPRRRKGVYRARKQRHYRFRGPTGEIVEVSDLTAFCLKNGLSRDRMVCAYNDPNTSHRGYRSVESTQQPRRLVFVSPAGMEHIVQNITQFARENDLNREAMGRLSRGELRRTTDGWTLKS